MPTAGAPDFQYTVVDVAEVGAGAPDFQRVIVGPGGSPVGGGYASLTGPGQTATPGDLTQQGGLTVDDNGDGVTLNTSGGVAVNDSSSSGGFYVTATGTGGITLLSAYGVLIANNGNPGDGFIQISSNNGLVLTEDSTLGVQVQANTPGNLGFYGATPVTRPAAPVTLGDVIAGLQALGLFAT